MVQRKVANKLGIQADHVKSEKGLVTHKPSSFHHQDGKNRGGADLKKKMKKSRSIKRSDFESLQSPNLRRDVPQPGKPPPLAVPTSPAIQQKQSPVKALDVSPNYMKPTSSSHARKERSQVSTRNSPTSIESRKNSNNPKLSSASGHKPSRTLTRTSSLKLVRTLTKTPSFKPARASAKKCSPVALCEDFNVQKATCSSTLKDSKFPAYLTLTPGGTESEGTSAMKVCPYTYCSLNGHHHAPLPPLKCFLSARRRMLKMQKSIKLGCLSPRRARPSGEITNEIDTEQLTFNEKPVIQELDLNGSAITPPIQEEHADFFIEIYGKEREDKADTIGRSQDHGHDHRTTDFSVTNILASVGASGQAAAEHDDGQVVESLFDQSPCSEIDFEDNLGKCTDVFSTEKDIAKFFPEEDQNAEVAEEVYPASQVQEEKTPECLSNQHDVGVEIPPSSQQDELDSEGSDMEWEAGQYSAMEWEAGQYSAPYLDDEVDNSIQTNNEFDGAKGYSLEIANCTFHDEPIFKSDDHVRSYFEEIRADEVPQESFDEESQSSEAWLCDSNSKSDGSYQNLESNESIQVSDSQGHDQISPTLDAIEESTTTEEKDGDTMSDEFVHTGITFDPVKEPIEQPRSASDDKNGASEADNETLRIEFQLGDDKNECNVSIEDEALVDREENESLQDGNATTLLRNQESDYSYDLTEVWNEIYMDYTASHNSNEVYQSDAVTDRFTDKDSETDQNGLGQLLTADAGDGMEEKEQVDSARSLVEIQTYDSLQGSSEAEEDMNSEDHDKSQLGARTKENKSSQTFADEGLPADTQDHSYDGQSQSNDVIENQNHSEEDQDEAENLKTPKSMDSEDQTHSGMARLHSAENRDQDVHKMEMEYTTKSDAEETCNTAKVMSSTETKNAAFHAVSSSKQELPKTCKNPRATIRRKRPAEEWEEPRKFNPREPNYLPVEPEPEAEKVDLRHQMMDEKKNAEEWMVDYALRQAVTKLAPARKRKVALLVEAFETVMPTPKYETNLRHTSATFVHTRPIQACS